MFLTWLRHADPQVWDRGHQNQAGQEPSSRVSTRLARPQGGQRGHVLCLPICGGEQPRLRTCRALAGDTTETSVVWSRYMGAILFPISLGDWEVGLGFVMSIIHVLCQGSFYSQRLLSQNTFQQSVENIIIYCHGLVMSQQ